ncbi:TetR family transcriptional regulator [Streptomyces sulfonofaciens]|uniref:TetR family transcriptional regulator n=2 Tax=Streptomyces sulfonofaciens TaxID=68272 RepID=A0A919G5B2_9ACTN|nr:TetR/AcrR family transcriptional regulator [Streptomyces sulfonofaciens]GHH77596.1 TetR family transcriptional regulator [Streptomyces sulfonofaciens]
MIVAVALPLIAEHGTAVTTSRIARAAGIGEATVFRAFKDKDELLDACVAEAVSPGHVLRELACIELEEPLAARLVQAAEAMRAHLDRMGSVLGSLHASGRRRGRTPDGPPAEDGRAASMRALREAVAELLEPDRAALRIGPERLAAMFLGMVLMHLRETAGDAVRDPAELVDVLLYGALERTGAGGGAPAGGSGGGGRDAAGGGGRAAGGGA